MTVAKRRTTFIAELDQRELQVRIMEAILRMKRPAGVSPEQLLADMEPQDRDASARGAVAALEYFRECVAKGQAPS